MDDLKQDYQQLADHLEEVSHLSGVMGVLHWDQEVIMPSGGGGARAHQLATLSGVIHEKSTDTKVGETIRKLAHAGSPQFSEVEWRNIQEAQRDFERETKVPKSLVQEIAELSSRGHEVWVKARQENSFKDFAPVLSKFIDLKKQYAHHIDPNTPEYEVNLDDFERGATIEQLDPLFEGLKAELIPLIKQIAESDHKPDGSILEGKFPIEKQEALGKQISTDMGFCFDQGRMDVAVHPFCGGGHPTDVRITTRYRDDDFIESLYAVIHETGHGLYEQGRPKEWGNLPVAESLTMGIHESQSLFWERMIAQSKSFARRYQPLFSETFPNPLKRVSADALFRAINISKPSFIRVEADEVTYPLHVILRYEIEKGLFDGSMAVDDLPEIWNGKMKKYLGICPPSDAKGVLQDVHWSSGLFGYFPSYTLGAMYACQFFQALKLQIPNVEELVERGDFATIRAWLRDNIHSKGRLYSTSELVQQVTGQPLSADVFIRYLNEKYSEIYQLN